MGEGKWGGYTAHSQSGKWFEAKLDGDRFDHIVVGDKFRFSTGIGPFQIDRGGYGYDVYGPYGKWGSMPTIVKLDPEIALREVLYWHYNVMDFGKDACLNDFQIKAKSVWHAVSDAEVAQNWYEVTGTLWNEHNKGKVEDFRWSDVANLIRRDDSEYLFENNVKFIGEVKWNVAFTTDSGQVSFDGYYSTWYITARSYTGASLFGYYYTYDATVNCELWVWNNKGEEDEFKYIFARELNEPFPRNRTHEGHYWIDNWYIARAGEYRLDKPALNPNLVHVLLGLDLIFTIDTTGSMWDDIDNVKAAASAIVEEIDAEISDYRIAVVDYKDFPVSPYGDPSDYTFHDISPFSTDKSSIITAIQALTVGGGADWEESVYSALMHSINATSRTFHWIHFKHSNKCG